jgi:RNA polymerase sigma factor (sigma-70 family)
MTESLGLNGQVYFLDNPPPNEEPFLATKSGLGPDGLRTAFRRGMTKEEYGSAYEKGYTTRFLVSRGLSGDCAQETAQAAWVRGWEKCGQLRDPKMVLTWTTTIALNLYRTGMRHEPFLQELPEIVAPHKTNLAVIDLQRVLKTCKKDERMVLQRHYLEGYRVREIALANGCSDTAVRIRLLRARRAVAKKVNCLSVVGFAK